MIPVGWNLRRLPVCNRVAFHGRNLEDPDAGEHREVDPETFVVLYRWSAVKK